MSDNALLRIENLTKEYLLGSQRVTALAGVSLGVQRGEYVAIMGPSGSGKSTMLNLLGCLDRPSRGHYFLGDQDVANFDDTQLSEVRNRRIGFVFQSFNLIAQMSILENIEVPLFYQGIPRAERRRRSTRLADLVGLGDRIHHRPRELSGGQQQRVAIARSLANDPLLVLADEPTGNLDTQTTTEILSIFQTLYDEGRTIIMITHEDDVAAHAKRVIRLRDGKVESDVLNSSRQRRPAAVHS